MWPTPWRSSDDVVITASAPTSRYFTTCSAVSTPVLAAIDPRSVPASTPIHSSGARTSLGCDSVRSRSIRIVVRSMSGW